MIERAMRPKHDRGHSLSRSILTSLLRATLTVLILATFILLALRT